MRAIRVEAVRALLALGLCARASGAAPAELCQKTFAQLARPFKVIDRFNAYLSEHPEDSLTDRLVKTYVKLALYPIVGPFSIAKTLRAEGQGSYWRLPVHLVRREGGFIAASILLHLVSGQLLISLDDLEKAIHRDVNEDLKKGIYVVADGFPESGEEIHHLSFEAEVRQYHTTPNVFFIHASSPQDLKNQLENLHREHGLIGALELHAHGRSGNISIGGHDVDADQLSELAIHDVFNAGAKVYLMDCGVGRGEKGKIFTENLGAAFLDKGGTVWSSRATIEDRVEIPLLGPRVSRAGQSVFNFATDQTGVKPALSILMISEEPDLKLFQADLKDVLQSRVRETKISGPTSKDSKPAPTSF